MSMYRTIDPQTAPEYPDDSESGPSTLDLGEVHACPLCGYYHQKEDQPPADCRNPRLSWFEDFGASDDYKLRVYTGTVDRCQVDLVNDHEYQVAFKRMPL